MKKTPIQKHIENIVTNGRGYSKDELEKPLKIGESNLGLELQLSLLYMDRKCNKISSYEFIENCIELFHLAYAFKKTNTPLNLIKTADDLKYGLMESGTFNYKRFRL
ncbi:MAG: hypothetical protein WC867_01215 [Candidatus Pacearchaeota archaeon]|jgi:hypothetical protein